MAGIRNARQMMILDGAIERLASQGQAAALRQLLTAAGHSTRALKRTSLQRILSMPIPAEKSY